MSKNNQEHVIFMLTRDEVPAYAKELGIPVEQVTDGVIELVKGKLEVEFSYWPEIIKEVLTQATNCPLGLTCFPSCCWRKNGRCIFPQEA